ncbi:MAG: hypothetical protein ACRDVZ_04130, partial [Jiangellaceae bacterium]
GLTVGLRLFDALGPDPNEILEWQTVQFSGHRLDVHVTCLSSPTSVPRRTAAAPGMFAEYVRCRYRFTNS